MSGFWDSCPNTPTPSGLTAISKGLHLADEDLPVQRLDGIGPSAQLGASALRKDQPFGPCSEFPYAGILSVEAARSETDLGKGQTMFEGLASRFERNQLLDELCGDLDSMDSCMGQAGRFLVRDRCAIRERSISYRSRSHITEFIFGVRFQVHPGGMAVSRRAGE